VARQDVLLLFPHRRADERGDGGGTRDKKGQVKRLDRRDAIGQVKRLDGRDSVGQAKFVESPFGIAA